MRNALHDLVEVVQTVYPDIEALSVENSDGSWEVFAQIRYRSRRIPVALHSSGASRLVGILLSMAQAERGVVLIDELENGFYYKSLSTIWRVLLTMAESFKCQVFASTHSRECIQALGEAINPENEKSFGLLNIENRSGASRIVLSTGAVMSAAIHSGFEIR
jgi:predicted ATPase